MRRETQVEALQRRVRDAEASPLPAVRPGDPHTCWCKRPRDHKRVVAR